MIWLTVLYQSLLTFLQEWQKWAEKHPHKVYVAAISILPTLLDGSSVGQNDQFMGGERQTLNPSLPSILPIWDLAVLDKAVLGPPFEP